jgi:hypothetical protein
VANTVRCAPSEHRSRTVGTVGCTGHFLAWAASGQGRGRWGRGAKRAGYLVGDSGRGATYTCSRIDRGGAFFAAVKMRKLGRARRGWLSAKRFSFIMVG